MSNKPYIRTKQHGINISLAKRGKRTSISTEFKSGHGRLRSLESYQNMPTGKDSWNFKTGVALYGTGYLYKLSPNHPNRDQNGRVAVHRLKMEKRIKRYLRPKELVHHIDGDKTNNKISNLLLFSGNKEHLQWHSTNRD